MEDNDDEQAKGGSLNDAIDVSRVFDAHAHLHLGRTGLSERRTGLMSTVEGDWKRLEAALEGDREEGKLFVGFGLHPFWVHETRVEGWQQRLRDALARHPRAIVGEIGLDKAHRNRGNDNGMDPNENAGGSASWTQQVEVFEEQVDIAAMMRRPACLHVVQAWGYLIDECLKRRLHADGGLPPRLLLHSYSGSPCTALQLLKLLEPRGVRVYFGFSAQVNARAGMGSKRRARTLEAMRCVPADRILVESDLHEADEAPEQLAEIVRIVAEARQWSAEKVVRVTAANAEYFYDPSEWNEDRSL